VVLQRSEQRVQRGIGVAEAVRGRPSAAVLHLTDEVVTLGIDVSVDIRTQAGGGGSRNQGIPHADPRIGMEGSGCGQAAATKEGAVDAVGHVLRDGDTRQIEEAVAPKWKVTEHPYGATGRARSIPRKRAIHDGDRAVIKSQATALEGRGIAR